jgi:aarF domain-containing kinase
MPWVRKLVVLCDGAPETPYKMVQKVIEQEFGKPMDSIFERFDCKPLGSASVAQVHRARVRGATKDVAVKVLHPVMLFVLIVGYFLMFLLLVLM